MPSHSAQRDEVPDRDVAGRREHRERDAPAASSSDCVTKSARRRSTRSASDAGERAEHEDADAAAERDDAEQPRRAGEPVGEPAHRDLLQPGADQRQALPDEEQPEIRGGAARERCASARSIAMLVHRERSTPRRRTRRPGRSDGSCRERSARQPRELRLRACSSVALNPASRARSCSTTAAGARATKPSLPSLALALAISPSSRAISLPMRSRSAAGSTSMSQHQPRLARRPAPARRTCGSSSTIVDFRQLAPARARYGSERARADPRDRRPRSARHLLRRRQAPSRCAASGMRRRGPSAARSAPSRRGSTLFAVRPADTAAARSSRPCLPASGATVCHSSSVMNGMNGCASRSIASSTRTSVRRVPRCAASSPRRETRPWRSSTYQSQYSSQTNS